MKISLLLLRLLMCASVVGMVLPAVSQAAGKYKNFKVAVYMPVGVVEQNADLNVLAKHWKTISSQVKVDKVYIEVQRDRTVASDKLIEQTKKFFEDHGVEVAGGITFSDNNSGQFRSFCYTNPEDRAFVKHGAELAARHFNEVILDDFFFVTTKYPSDIAAKGNRSWTDFRLALMDDVAKNLVVGPAKAVNPKVKMIVKFPNWYEHFQGLGFDLSKEPEIFDGIYTGTETRDPLITDQFLQSYESYQIFRYFENIKPGKNGGGWVDTYGLTYIDRYPEQLWDTLFAKAPEITLFNFDALLEPIQVGNRRAWQGLPTSFDLGKILSKARSYFTSITDWPTMASVAGQALEQIDPIVGKLGNPIGIESYKPYNSSGEDFLHNYFGMMGIPIDLHPTFPTDAKLVLLTQSAAHDPKIVDEIKGQLDAGKNVVITSGLLKALQGRGIEDIIEASCTDRRFLATGFSSGYGAGDRETINEKGPGLLFPQVKFLTNDAWALVSGLADRNGYPLMLMDRYGKGILYIWTIPDVFSDLYRLPEGVTRQIHNVVMQDFPVRIDGPSRIALYAYDNHTFIVESYLPSTSSVQVTVQGDYTKLKDLTTGDIYTGQPVRKIHWGHHGSTKTTEAAYTFNIRVLPHSYLAFQEEK